MAITPVEKTPIPTGVPKTGSMTYNMAKIVAKNISADIRGENLTGLPVDEMGIVCFTDMGNTAVLMVAKPALPPRQTVILKKKRWVRWMKIAFEKYFINKLKIRAFYLP